jgi:hypothetical protein
MAKPLALPLSERIEEIQAEIDELIVSMSLGHPPSAFPAIGLSNHCLRGMAACAAANSQSWFSVRKKRRMSKTQTALERMKDAV